MAADLPDPLPRLPRATVWSSPSSRCRLLAEALARRHRHRPRIDPRLQELDFGAWEGAPWDTIDRDRLTAWARASLGRSGPGSESAAALIRRCRLFARALAGRPGHHVVVAHAGPLVVLRCLLEHRPIALLAPRPGYGKAELVRCPPASSGCRRVDQRPQRPASPAIAVRDGQRRTDLAVDQRDRPADARPCSV